jgi:hypothetical protein
MTVWFLFFLAAVMAVFGIIGYKQGFWPMVLALIVLFLAALIIRQGADTIIKYMNGMFLGAMLVFKSGLSDIAAGDLDSAAQKLESIEKPFADEREWFAYLLIIGAAVFFGWLIGVIMKNTPSIWGGLVGLVYGYVLCAALVPLILGFSSWFLPIFGAGESEAVSPLAAEGSCGGIWGRLVCFLGNPQAAQICGIVIVIAIGVFILWAARATTGATTPKRG